MVKNHNWQETDQLAIYQAWPRFWTRDYWETNPASDRAEALNPGPKYYNTSALNLSAMPPPPRRHVTSIFFLIRVRLRTRPHVYGYFWIRNIFFQIQNFPRPHVAKISRFAAEFAECVWTEVVSGKKKLLIPNKRLSGERTHPHALW